MSRQQDLAHRVSAIMRGLNPVDALPPVKRRPQWDYDIEATLRAETKRKQPKRKRK